MQPPNVSPPLLTPAHFQRRRPSDPPPQNGKTPLHVAATHGWLPLIDKLLAMGADVDAKDNKVSPPTLPPSLVALYETCSAAHSLARAASTSPITTHSPASAYRGAFAPYIAASTPKAQSNRCLPPARRG